MKHIQVTALFANTMESNNLTTMISNDAGKLDISAPGFKEAIDILIAHEYTLCSGDEDAADELLADLEPCLRRLTWAHNEWLRGLSGDLHMLNDEETFEKNPYPMGQYWLQLREAWSNHEADPEGFLRLLRFEHPGFPLDEIAFMRSQAYMKLGFLPVATAFIEAASRFDPENAGYKVLLMGYLNKLGKNDEVNQIVETVLESDTVDPELVGSAAALFFNRTFDMPIPDARRILGRLRKRLQEAFRQTDFNTIRPTTIVLGYHTLGNILTRLNRSSEARFYYEEALKIEPTNQDILTDFASSTLSHNAESAFQIFGDLVARGTKNGIPYLILAKKAVAENDYSEAIRLSNELLIRSDNPFARAHAYQFLGLCEAEENGPTDKARDLLIKALNLAPNDSLIRANLEQLEKIRNGQSQNNRPNLNERPHNWLLFDQSVLGAMAQPIVYLDNNSALVTETNNTLRQLGPALAA